MNISNEETRTVLSLLKPNTFLYAIGLIGSSLIDGSTSIICALVLKDIIDAGVMGEKSLIIKASILLCVVAFTFSILSTLFNYLFSASVKKVMASIRLKVFYHLEEIKVEYYESNHSGNITSRFLNDIGSLENFYKRSIKAIFILILSGVYSAVLMLILNYKMAIVLIIIGLITGYVNIKYARVLRKLGNKCSENKSDMVKHLTDLLGGFREVKMFNLGKVVVDGYHKANYKGAKLSLTYFKKYAFLDSINFLLMWVSNGIAFIVGTILVFNGTGTVGTLFAMVLMVGNITNIFRQLGNEVARMQLSLASGVRVLELLELPKEDISYKLSDKILDEGKIIEIKNGVFSYQKDNSVIKGINLKIEKGKLAAMVGPSGGGKSTIIKLLLGLYPMESGILVINGKQIGEYTLEELRNMISYVPQETYLFHGTIEENIKYGRVDARNDEVIMAAKLANAHEFILNQPNGYKTVVGERGGRLSGGQKQRISIARAILKDSPILILDEATSALDSESEQLVQDALNRLIKGRTTIAVAHRLSTIKNADIVYVINKGIAEEIESYKNLNRTIS